MNAPPVDPESTSKQENETREGCERLSETLSPHFADEKVEQCDLHHLPKVIKI